MSDYFRYDPLSNEEEYINKEGNSSMNNECKSILIYY